MAFQIHILPLSLLVKPEQVDARRFRRAEEFPRLLQPPQHPRQLTAAPRGVRSDLPLLLWLPSETTLAARGECAGRFQGARCCGSPRRPCAAGPVQTPGVDRCPSASSGSPATPSVWRKQA